MQETSPSGGRCACSCRSHPSEALSGALLLIGCSAYQLFCSSARLTCQPVAQRQQQLCDNARQPLLRG